MTIPFNFQIPDLCRAVKLTAGRLEKRMLEEFCYFILFFSLKQTGPWCCVHAETWERKDDSYGGDFQEGGEGFG